MAEDWGDAWKKNERSLKLGDQGRILWKEL